MALAITLQKYLEERDIEYDVVNHPPTQYSSATAYVSDISPHCLAKGVVIKGKGGYAVAVIPASRRLDYQLLDDLLGEHHELASEDELRSLFPDCEVGAVPALAMPYGLRVLVDESLEGQTDVYFEGGDHATLVHVGNITFHELMEATPHGSISVAH